MRKKAKTLLSFITGASVGALLGILLAPESGTNTRGKLNFTLAKYREKILELIEELTEEQDKLSNTAREYGSQVVSEVKDKAEEILDDVDKLINRIEEEDKR